MTRMMLAVGLTMAAFALVGFAVLFASVGAWRETLACAAPVVPLAMAASWIAAEGMC